MSSGPKRWAEERVRTITGQQENINMKSVIKCHEKVLVGRYLRLTLTII